MTAPVDNAIRLVSTLRQHWLWEFVRPGFEFVVCLVMLVLLFRTFLAEGYVIETGSMAPNLLGHYVYAVCPSCRFPITAEASGGPAPLVCPNCGQRGISVEGLVRNDGDQLLVDKTAYDFHRPRRWEVAVFRNPGRPTQTYVKRLVGLPGEQVQISEGDVYVSGGIQSKGLETQRGMRILVYDHDYRPPDDDPDWQPRWVRETADSRWQLRDNAFVLHDRRTADPDQILPLEWVRYRHWIRSGGRHATSVGLSRWPSSELALPPAEQRVRYESDSGNLICYGALSRELRDRWLAGATDREFQEAINRLYEASHLAPITDHYGYNRSRPGIGVNEVRDVMLQMNLEISAGAGQFALGISDGTEDFECVLDLGARQIRLIRSHTDEVVRTAVLPEKVAGGASTLIEWSLMDRQVLLAVNGVLPFEPWQYPPPRDRGPTPWIPVRFGARGLDVQVSGLKLYRDVYYTAGNGLRGSSEAVQLGPHQYFALGDNSPISKDSRSWPIHQTLRSELLLGKPFLVHLPSRKRRLQVGGWRAYIRVPEFSQIRYIR